MFVAPTVTQFQTQFVRDFPYGTDPNVAVLDVDIINAFNLVDTTINQALFSTQSQFQIAYGYLAAHFLVLNLRASSQGLNGQYTWAQNSKSVGQVSEAFTIPQRVIDNPNFMQYTKTNYGAMYLNLLWPLLVGQAFTVCGTTHP